jgi:hypothetical protein
LRLAQLLPLHTVQLGYPFALLTLAQPRLLRGHELPLFQRFEITVFDDALGFAAIDDGFGFPRIVRLAFEERDGSADQAFPLCAKRFQRVLLPLIDALDLVSVSGDGRVLVFFEAVHLAVVQSTHVVGLPTMLLLLLRFLTLLALGDRGLCASPDIRGEHMPFVLLCGDGFGLVSVFRLATELSSSTLLFDGGLSILCAPLGFFSDGLLSVFRALLFLLPAAFGPPPFLNLRRLGLSLCVGLRLFSLATLLTLRDFLCAVVAHAGLRLSPHRMFVARGVSLLIVVGHVAVLPVATLPPAPADTRGTEIERVRWTYLDHRVAEAVAPVCDRLRLTFSGATLKSA